MATSELESMENTKSILDYITYYQEKNIELNNDNIKEIERILRAELIKRLVRVKCKEEDFANFLYGLNEKKKNITKSEFLFTYEIANKHCLTTKIIQPIFEIEDALSIAFRFEKGYYYRGLIFENSKVSDKKLDGSRKDIMSKKYDSMTDLFRMVIKYFLSKIDGIDIYALLKIDNSEDLEQKLNEINNSNKDMETTIECFRKCQKIGSLFDKIIQIQNKKKKNYR